MAGNPASSPDLRTSKPARRKTWVHSKMSDDKARRILPGLRAGLTLHQVRLGASKPTVMRTRNMRPGLTAAFATTC
jgi:hypothetical protein